MSREAWQDVYLGPRVGNAGNVAGLEAYNPDLPPASDHEDDTK